MIKNNSFIKSSSSTVTLLAILIIYSIISLSAHQYERLTGDSTFFFDIARKYLDGDFSNAVNGFWGPLLSWILVPFLYFGIPDVTAINVLSVIMGVLTLVGIWLLSFRFDMSDKIRVAILISSLPIILQISLVEPQDLLLLCILIYYLNVTFNRENPLSITHSIAAGSLGAIAYFCKSYAFPFFLSHFFLMNVLRFFKFSSSSNRKRILRNTAAGYLVFFIISAPWITSLYNKYDQVTFATTGKNNLAAVGPAATGENSYNPIYGREKGWPIFYAGFIEPPNDTATSVWEDPTYLDMPAWNPFGSWKDIKHLINLILKNISQSIQIINLYSSISFAILFAYILLCIRPRSDLAERSDLSAPLLTVLLYSAGYMLVHQELRYLWIVNILLLLMGGQILNILFQNTFFDGNFRRNALLILFILSFIVAPSRYILKVGSDGEYFYRLSQELQSEYNIRGNIATNKELAPVNDAWHKTFRLAYYLKSRYYGQSRHNISEDALHNELIKYNIDYYFVWGESSAIPEFLTGYNEVTGGNIPGLRVYSIKGVDN